MEGELQTTGRKCWIDAPLACTAEFHTSLTRICSWRVPPNWSAADWFEEIRAIAAGAAWQAECDFDSSRGVALGAFVRSRVLGRTLARYRQEWAFGTHCLAEAQEPQDGIPHRSTGEPVSTFACQDSPAADALREALSGLSEADRRLIEQLFWEGRTEAEIGGVLGISQRAVSKRKQAALVSLRQFLDSRIRSLAIGYSVSSGVAGLKRRARTFRTKISAARF